MTIPTEALWAVAIVASFLAPFVVGWFVDQRSPRSGGFLADAPLEGFFAGLVTTIAVLVVWVTALAIRGCAS